MDKKLNIILEDLERDIEYLEINESVSGFTIKDSIKKTNYEYELEIKINKKGVVSFGTIY